MDLVEEQGGKQKELEGMKDESQLIKYPQHDMRTGVGLGGGGGRKGKGEFCPDVFEECSQ